MMEDKIGIQQPMVWKHLGSYAIEIAGLAILDEFVEEITDSSPAAGPLMNALLKGAYSFAFYQLKKENKNLKKLSQFLLVADWL